MNAEALKGKIAVVTGGNSGIGLESARLFRRHGASVVILGQNERTLEGARSELGGDTLSLKANVADPVALKAAMEKVKSAFGRIDILFANAGISHCPPLLETTSDDFDRIVGINMKGIFFTFVHALPLLSEKASVILTGSAAQSMGRLGDPIYSATKAAVRSFARTFAVDELVQTKSIRVNAIVPGCVKTPLTEPASSNAEVTAYLESIIPLKRWGEANEIAKAVLFLASDDSSYMTGAEISVDGGLAQV